MRDIARGGFFFIFGMRKWKKITFVFMVNVFACAGV